MVNRRTLFPAALIAAELLWGLLLLDAGRHFRPADPGFQVRDLGFRVSGIYKNGPVTGVRGDILVERAETSTSGRNSLQLMYVSPFQTDLTTKRAPFLWHLVMPLGISLGAVELGQGSEPRLPFLHLSNRRLALKWMDMQSRIRKEVTLADPAIPFPSDNVGCGLGFLGDLDGDGRRDALIHVESGFMGLPRGVFARDAETGGKKFDFMTAGVPHQVLVDDLDGDGRREILVSIWSPHNGVVYADMDDDHAVLAVLNDRGKPVWTSILGGYFSEIEVATADLDGDGAKEIIAARACHRAEEPDPGELNVIEARTGRILATYREPGVSFTRPVILPAVGDGRPTIAIGDSAGRLRLFDSGLTLLKTVALAPRVFILGTFRPRPAHPPLLVVSSGSNRLLVMDTRFRTRFPFEVKDSNLGASDMVTLSDGEAEHAVVNADHIWMLSYAPLGLAARLGGMLATPLVGLLALGLFGNALLLAYRRAGRRNTHLAAELATRDRAQDWTGIVQEIVHRMKTPLFTVQLEAEKLARLRPASASPSPQTDPAAISASILDDVKLLARQTRQLMQLAAIPSAAKTPADLVALLRRLGESYRLHLQGRISIELDLPAEPVILPIHTTQIQEALTNLIDNAIDALPEGGRVRISAMTRRRGGRDHARSVEIEVEDNGQGIPDALLARIFEPSFTTKAGGLGLGLPIAKRIIEGHEGTIQIHSRPGLGTRVAIVLPWKGR